MRPTVFIHSNHRQRLGALVSAHSLARNSDHADAFDVKIIWLEDHPFFDRYEGRNYLRGGDWRPWRNDDLQSFTPLRFMPPQLMGYEGQAVIMDPDIFAAGDIYDLLTRDMEGHAVSTRLRTGAKSREECRATSVMLLDCARHAAAAKRRQGLMVGWSWERSGGSAGRRRTWPQSLPARTMARPGHPRPARR